MRNLRRRSTRHLANAFEKYKRIRKEICENEFKKEKIYIYIKVYDKNEKEEETIISQNVVCPILGIISCIESNRTLFAFFNLLQSPKTYVRFVLYRKTNKLI